MADMKIEAVGRTEELGARVTGVDLRSELAASDWEELTEAWNRHHLLFFPDQLQLSTEAHVDFLSRFGPVIEERIPGDKFSYVTNALGKGTDDMNTGYREGELTPHMDYTYTNYPADIISLFCEELPSRGSHTLFYSNVAAFESLPVELCERLRGYTIHCAHDLAAMVPDARLYREPRTCDDAPTQSHDWPLIRSHPKKPGVQLLYATMQQTERILELSDERLDDRESRSLLAEIFEKYLYIEANEYRHNWALGDLVVWDNMAMQHARKPCPLSEGARSFRRVAVCEAGNGITDTVEFLNLRDTSHAFS